MILYCGDFNNGNGPSQVDQNLKLVLEKGTSKFTFFDVGRDSIGNLIKELIMTSVIHVSGVSFKGVIALLLGKLFFKKVYVTSHGLLAYEKKFRYVPVRRLLFEKVLLFFAQKIVAVSNSHKNQIVNIFNNAYSKVVTIPNGVVFERQDDIKIEKDIDILTVGGGRPEKRVLEICKAIEALNAKSINPISLVVVGENGLDTDKINSYSFVNNYGFISHEDLVKLYQRTKCYIQYSEYESFGIAPLEAVVNGASLIVSPYIGSISSVKVLDPFIATGYEDLRNKIAKVLKRPNNKACLKGIPFNEYNWEIISEKYIELWSGNIR